VAIREAGQLCVNLAMVRGGRHLGDRPFFPTNAGDSDSAEACAAFIRQHYAGIRHLTRILVTPCRPKTRGVKPRLLAELAGRPVPIREAQL
jgi:excinuclease ABC subunit C